jgi:hypothetical protein
MNSQQGIVKKEREIIFEKINKLTALLQFFEGYDLGFRLFFLTIPKPLKQHPL